MYENSYLELKNFTTKYPGGVTWFRLKKHCAIIDRHLNPDEVVEFIFAGQLDNDSLSFFNTGVVAITNQRLLVAQNRLLIGYSFSSVTPDLYNDLQVSTGLFWGTLTIDTVKERIYVSNLSKKSLADIETNITTRMQELKKEYYKDSEGD